MSKKANNNTSLLNVSGAYSIAKDGKVKPVSYKEVTNGSVKVNPETINILTEVFTGILEETNSAMKIGYNLHELTKGNTPEYLKLGYASIKQLIEDMFDMNPVTGYAWSDTAGAFIVKDGDTYHSIFQTIEDGKTYDFTISQLMEMRSGSENKKLPDSLWKMCFDNSVIFTTSTTKGIRLIRNILCDMVDRKEIDFDKISQTEYADTIIERIKAIRNIAIENNCKPIDAIKMIDAEKAQTEQAQTEQAQTAQAQPAQAQPTQAQPTQAQPTQAQPAQAQPTQAQTAQAQPAQSGNVPEVENAIQQAIENGKIDELVNSDIMPKIHRYVEFAQNHNSNIVKCALVDFLEYALNIVTNTPTEETPTEETPTEETPTEETPTEETPTEETPTEETNTKGKGKGKKSK